MCGVRCARSARVVNLSRFYRKLFIDATCSAPLTRPPRPAATTHARCAQAFCCSHSAQQPCTAQLLCLDAGGPSMFTQPVDDICDALTLVMSFILCLQCTQVLHAHKCLQCKQVLQLSHGCKVLVMHAGAWSSCLCEATGFRAGMCLVVAGLTRSPS